MLMFFKHNDCLIMSPKNLDFPSISAGEYDAKMAEIEKEINQSMSDNPAPEPTAEERIAALEATTDDIVLMMAELIGGE